MDSQENALTQGTEEVKQAEEANKVNPPSGEETAPIAAETAEDAQQAQEEELAKKVYTSKKEIVDRLGEIAKSETTPDKAEIEHLKTTFYKLHFAEREAEQKAFVEAGGDPEKFQILPDDDEQAFKAEMTIIKEKRQKAFQELEQLKQDNLQKKLEIIEKIKAMVTTAEEANANFQNFKALQAEWKEIKPVPAEKANELWRNYQLYVEQFYDLINLNREAREYDFKKNLEKKTALCEAAENWPRRRTSSAPRASSRTSTCSIARRDPWRKTCASNCGLASRLPVRWSTSATSSSSRTCAHARTTTWRRRRPSARRWRPS